MTCLRGEQRQAAVAKSGIPPKMLVGGVLMGIMEGQVVNEKEEGEEKGKSPTNCQVMFETEREVKLFLSTHLFYPYYINIHRPVSLQGTYR